jgi:hypothetical protein
LGFEKRKTEGADSGSFGYKFEFKNEHKTSNKGNHSNEQFGTLEMIIA